MSRILFGLALVLVVCCICYVSADKFEDDVSRYTKIGLEPTQDVCVCHALKCVCDLRRNTLRLYTKIIKRQVEDDCLDRRSFVCGDELILQSEMTMLSDGHVNCNYVDVMIYILTGFKVCCDVTVID